MSLLESNDGTEQGSSWPISGTAYSRILVYRCRENLHEILGRSPTNEEVAKAIGVAVDDIGSVTTAEKTFGAGLFQRLATERDQTLITYMADLVRWSRENLG